MNVDLHKPRKRFGQHFLHDPLMIGKIIDAIDPKRDDCIVEIGPGKGALTLPLLEKTASLSVIELDRDLAARLSRKFSGLPVYQQDALEFNFSELNASNIRLVGNLPYNISSELIFRLLDYRKLIRDMIFMLQKEVADRICAGPSSPGYCRLSVMCQTYYRAYPLFAVGPHVFDPPPRVESAIVRFIPIGEPGYSVSNETYHENLVRQAFSQRRKTIRNALKPLLQASELEHLLIAPDKRAENLSIEEYVKLANYYADKQITPL